MIDVKKLRAHYDAFMNTGRTDREHYRQIAIIVNSTLPQHKKLSINCMSCVKKTINLAAELIKKNG